MEAFERIQHYGQERQDAQALADARWESCLELIGQARKEGYSMEAIANAIGVSRQQLYSRLDSWEGELEPTR
ncbi:hypothetical protein UFOVP1346_49 [uncultured Caudovirales phage]|uniref:Uncharacterized protein n=1 Tax=uncultured Caudovirales phage TaxID=2100421 RepID=A0A6J5PLQ2_9CAUD|nr:hypothetical protein UFOVP921_29 [uncultured Caudovirales phage]CAB4187223.1 hypothetical protein UFOVP1156_5 [uncultured Caudovirales phage]CAB4200588.1 hypothetical protein UFOVP1346_49 [uncultured Caudovirales phage]